MNVADYRKALNLTQEDMSGRIGISRAAYANIENGKRSPSVSVAKRIAAVLGFDWTRFFDDEKTA